MQTLLFSEVDAKRECRGWHRVGHHINYSEYRQRSYNTLLERDINYFELDFQFVRLNLIRLIECFHLFIIGISSFG
jgi:hypothetical protein